MYFLAIKKGDLLDTMYAHIFSFEEKNNRVHFTSNIMCFYLFLDVYVVQLGITGWAIISIITILATEIESFIAISQLSTWDHYVWHLIKNANYRNIIFNLSDVIINSTSGLAIVCNKSNH